MNEVDRPPRGAPAGRPEGPPQRRRQQLPELERRDPDRAPAVGRGRDRGGAAPGARTSSRPRWQAEADEFWGVVKTGRTHLQDATPIRLGQEFARLCGPGRGSRSGGRRTPSDELLDGAARRDGGRDRDQRPPRVRGTGLRAPVRADRPARPRDRQPFPRPGDARRGDRRARRDPGDRRSACWKIAVGRAADGDRAPRAGIGELALPETQPGSTSCPAR